MCWHKWEYGEFIFNGEPDDPVVIYEQYKTCTKCGKEKKVSCPNVHEAASEWRKAHDA